MQGGVRKRGNIWYYYFELGIVNGKRKKIERKCGKSKREAQNALNEALLKYRNGYIEPAKMTVDNYLTDWLENFIKSNRKINTYYKYKSYLDNNILKYIGHIPLKDVRPIHIDSMISEEKKNYPKGSTLQGIYAAVNSAFNRAVKLQIMHDNPCRFVDRPKRTKFKANTLSVNEIDNVRSILDVNIYYDYIIDLAINIVLELGLRRGEIGGLEWKNIDFENSCIHIKKSLIYVNGKVLLGLTKTEESNRILYVSQRILKLLKKHKKIQNENRLKYGSFYEKNIFDSKERDFVMTWENGKYLHPDYYTKKFKKSLLKAGIEKRVRFHDLRHTNATLLLKEGTNYKVIQKRLGHADISTTLNIYAHVDIEMQKDATEKLNKLLSR